MKLVISLNADGTAAVTTPIAQPGETDADALARVLAATPGGEPLTAALAAALQREHAPPAGAVVPVTEFKRRAAMLWVRLGGAAAAVQAKWDRIAGSLLAGFRSIDLTDPTVRALADLAVADGLLTRAEADAVLAR